jgi:hypothetical protein
MALWLGEGWKERILLWLALSAGAILLERATASHEPIVAQYLEEAEGSGALSPTPQNSPHREQTNPGPPG